MANTHKVNVNGMVQGYEYIDNPDYSFVEGRDNHFELEDEDDTFPSELEKKTQMMVEKFVERPVDSKNQLRFRVRYYVKGISDIITHKLDFCIHRKEVNKQQLDSTVEDIVFRILDAIGIVWNKRHIS